MSVVIISILYCCVVAHLSTDIVGSVGVVDVDLGCSPEVSDLLALDQPDDKEDQKCDDNDTCLNQITVRRASFSTPVDQNDHDDETST